MDEERVKESLALCLDGLQEAQDALSDILDVDKQINDWHEKIESLSERISRRYER